MTGRLIVMEGCDGSGKTTLCRELVKRLLEKGVDAVLWTNPTAGVIGQKIRAMLRGEAEDLGPRGRQILFAADRWDAVPMLRKLLAEGKTVVSDRWWDSGVCYGRSDGLSIEFGLSLYDGFPIVPDVTCWLDVDPVRAVAREQGRVDEGGVRELYDGDVQRQAYLGQIYESLYALWINRNVRRVDANGTQEETLRQVEAILGLR